MLFISRFSFGMLLFVESILSVFFFQLAYIENYGEILKRGE